MNNRECYNNRSFLFYSLFTLEVLIIIFPHSLEIFRDKHYLCVIK